MADTPSAGTGAGGSPADRRQQAPPPEVGTFAGSPSTQTGGPQPQPPPKPAPKQGLSREALNRLFSDAYTALPNLTPQALGPPDAPQLVRFEATPEFIQEKQRDSPGGVGIISRYSLHVRRRSELQALADRVLNRSDTDLAIVNQIFGSALEDSLDHAAAGFSHLGTQCTFLDRDGREYFTGSATEPYDRQTRGDFFVLSVRRAQRAVGQPMPDVGATVMLRRGFVPIFSLRYDYRSSGTVYALTPSHPDMRRLAGFAPAASSEMPFTVEWLDSERTASAVVALKPVVSLSRSMYETYYGLREQYSNEVYNFLSELLAYYPDKRTLLSLLRYLNYPRLPAYGSSRSGGGGGLGGTYLL